MESLTDVLLSDRTGHKYILVFRGMNSQEQAKQTHSDGGLVRILLGMGAERRTRCRKLDLEGPGSHRCMHLSTLVRLQGELVCFSGCKISP